MSAAEQAGELELQAELAIVAEAAGARLRAETDEDAEASRMAAEELTQAATSAMGAGYSLTEIARAEARGKDALRRTLRADALKLVERTGSRAREAQAEHYRAIARASRLGLPMREIAQAAHVTHGTIRAITHRLASQQSESASQEQEPESASQEPEFASHEPDPPSPEPAPAWQGRDPASYGSDSDPAG